MFTQYKINVNSKLMVTLCTTLQSSLGQRLFCQDLHYLKLTDAFLSDGTLVQVPQFVAEACSYILEQCETEGLFRKAGSVAKQREIRVSGILN